MAFRDGRDRGLLGELCYGVLRWHPRLAALLKRLLDRPLKPRDRLVEALLLVGLYQLLYLRVPRHAAVNETVAACRTLDRPHLARLANAVLRRLLREETALLEALDRDPVAATAHPAWLLRALREAWPQEWQAIVAGGNRHPPLTLRVNRRRTTRDDYLGRLAQAGIRADPAPFVEAGLVVETPVPPDTLPGYAEGLFSVQDAAAQLCAGLLDLAPGQRVLDACAAPGGKTTHLLEAQPHLARLVAVDSAGARLDRLRENLERLGLTAEVRAADVGAPATWWDAQPFDRILLDAPCSATGVIRRHPDIKVLRRADDIPSLQAGQARLLDGVWRALARGGMLLYVTCSILPEENELQVRRFLERHPDARPRPMSAPWGRPRTPGRQTLPGEHDMDGFFFCRLEKA
jgi:16S rRNA (cytosine967-C5)-methyltransferase